MLLLSMHYATKKNNNTAGYHKSNYINYHRIRNTHFLGIPIPTMQSPFYLTTITITLEKSDKHKTVPERCKFRVLY